MCNVFSLWLRSCSAIDRNRTIISVLSARHRVKAIPRICAYSVDVVTVTRCGVWLYSWRWMTLWSASPSVMKPSRWPSWQLTSRPPPGNPSAWSPSQKQTSLSCSKRHSLYSSPLTCWRSTTRSLSNNWSPPGRNSRRVSFTKNTIKCH